MSNSTPVQISSICGIIGEITGKTPTSNTVLRWIRIGHKGVKLRVAGPVHFRFTTREWIDEFMNNCGTSTDAIHPVAVQSEESKRAKESLRKNFGFKRRETSQ